MPYTNLQSTVTAASLPAAKSHANFSCGNYSPDHIRKGTLGDVVLVARLTQYKIITGVKSEIPGRC